jgi:hypothetical protein
MYNKSHRVVEIYMICFILFTEKVESDCSGALFFIKGSGIRFKSRAVLFLIDLISSAKPRNSIVKNKGYHRFFPRPLLVTYSHPAIRLTMKFIFSCGNLRWITVETGTRHGTPCRRILATYSHFHTVYIFKSALIYRESSIANHVKAALSYRTLVSAVISRDSYCAQVGDKRYTLYEPSL